MCQTASPGAAGGKSIRISTSTSRTRDTEVGRRAARIAFRNTSPRVSPTRGGDDRGGSRIGGGENKEGEGKPRAAKPSDGDVKTAGKVSPPAGKLPRPPQTFPQAVSGTVQWLWCFVEPVFDPESGVRTRLEAQRLSWRDWVVFGAAVVYLGVVFLGMVVGAKVVGMGVVVIRVFGEVCRALIRM